MHAPGLLIRIWPRDRAAVLDLVCRARVGAPTFIRGVSSAARRVPGLALVVDPDTGQLLPLLGTIAPSKDQSDRLRVTFSLVQVPSWDEMVRQLNPLERVVSDGAGPS